MSDYTIWQMSNGVEIRVVGDVDPPPEGTEWQMVVSRENPQGGDEVTVYPVVMGKAISAEESRIQQRESVAAAERMRREDLAQFIATRLETHDATQLADAVLEYLDDEYDWLR